jgi:hypothetical protein
MSGYSSTIIHPKVKLKVKEHHASGPNITTGAIMDSIKTFSNIDQARAKYNHNCKRWIAFNNHNCKRWIAFNNHNCNRSRNLIQVCKVGITKLPNLIMSAQCPVANPN